jgi:hypothetical protein
MFRLPRSLDPQVAPTAEACPRGGRAVYTTHSPLGYLPRAVVSLRIRHEQLIRLDFHQLDCSLVGCSDVPDKLTFLKDGAVKEWGQTSTINSSRGFRVNVKECGIRVGIELGRAVP